MSQQEVPHGGARQRQRGAELSGGQNVTIRDSSSVSGFVGGQVNIQQFTLHQQPQGTSKKDTPGLKQTAPEDILNTNHMRAVMAVLQNFAYWKELGTNLGLDQQLNVIEKDASDNYGRVSKVIENWLKRNHNEEECGPPTWGNLAKAIRPIDNALAMKIEAQHGISSGTADTQPTARQPMQPPPNVAVEPMHVAERQPTQQPPNVHKVDDHEQKTASLPPGEQPPTTHGASSGQQMQVPSSPKRSPSPTSKGTCTLPKEALDTSELFDILISLQDLKNWHLLGLGLKMDFHFLNDIKKSQDNDADCKTAMLHAWLETGKATKSVLVAALKKMGENSIADKLQ